MNTCLSIAGSDPSGGAGIQADLKTMTVNGVYAMCAITALMASGAQMVLFTTGRGTPVGAPIPTVKVATNTPLAEKKRNWIDFNAGVLAQGADMEETTEAFFKKLLSIASGEKTQSETHDYREIAIFKDGVTL